MEFGTRGIGGEIKLSPPPPQYTMENSRSGKTGRGS